MGASDKTKRMVAFSNGPICAFPDCNHDFVETSGVAELAHIYGEKPGAARYNPNMTEEERNSADNLIYLCPNHHREIDKSENIGKYPPELLQEMKKKQEEAIKLYTEALAIPKCEELYDMARALANIEDVNLLEQVEFDAIEIDKKLKINNLTSKIKRIVKFSMTMFNDVSYILEELSKENETFSKKLRSRLISKYHELVCKGLSGDDLFIEILNFAKNAAKSRNPQEEQACYAIVVYLFTLCEIFEK